MITKTHPIFSSHMLPKRQGLEATNEWAVDENFLDLQLPNPNTFFQTTYDAIDVFHPLQFLEEIFLKEKEMERSDIDSPVEIDPPVAFFYDWLKLHPSWLEDNGFGGIQPQVITSSDIFSSLEFSNPGQARAFDHWYENIFLTSSADSLINHEICIYPSYDERLIPETDSEISSNMITPLDNQEGFAEYIDQEAFYGSSAYSEVSEPVSAELLGINEFLFTTYEI